MQILTTLDRKHVATTRLSRKALPSTTMTIVRDERCDCLTDHTFFTIFSNKIINERIRKEPYNPRHNCCCFRIFYPTLKTQSNTCGCIPKFHANYLVHKF